MRETVVEAALRVKAAQRGGIALKFVSPGLDGVPDRLVLLPGGKMGFVETKAPGKNMRPIQRKRKKQIEKLGMQVIKLDQLEDIDKTLDAIQYRR